MDRLKELQAMAGRKNSGKQTHSEKEKIKFHLEQTVLFAVAIYSSHCLLKFSGLSWC